MQLDSATISGFYITRNPRKTHYFQCVEAHFEELKSCWDELYRHTLGLWRYHLTDVIYRYLDCGDYQAGFARVRCDACGNEYLLPFSCKRRHFCPSCHQKRVIEFGEFILEEILQPVPHRHWVFAIPKRLRPFFMFDRTLLADLSRAAWNVLSLYLKSAVKTNDAAPGAIIAIQSFGDFNNFNPHCHIICSDGCFDGDGEFTRVAFPSGKDLEEAFRVEILTLLERKGKITPDVVDNMMSWPHSGFHVYCGDAIWSDEKESLEKLACYIIRASFSSERMTYIPAACSPTGKAQVIYRSKDGFETKTFSALDWLAKLLTHVPNKGEHVVRYYGFYSSRSRGIRKKLSGVSETVSADGVDGVGVSADEVKKVSAHAKAFRKAWALLIQKIYHIDPLLCKTCGGIMRIISFIEDRNVIKKILNHLGFDQGSDSDANHSAARASPPSSSGETKYVIDDYCQELPDIDQMI